MKEEIYITDDHAIKMTENGWHLHHYYDGKDKNGNPKRSRKVTYPYKIGVAINRILEETGENAKTAQDLARAWREVAERVEAVVNEIAKQARR